MRFADPQLLWLLLAVPLLALAMVLAARSRRRALRRFAGGGAQVAHFTTEVSAHRRAVRALLWLLAASATIVAAARPQWGTRLEEITRAGVDVVLVLDTSLSMSAEDVPPSRIDQARQAAAGLIDRLSGNRVSLVTFAGHATLLCPLTLDHAGARLFLDTVDVESVSVGGTALAESLELARQVLVSDGNVTRGRAVVLYSDGEDHEGELDAAIDGLRSAGIAVYAVGCGSARGAPIPLPGRQARFKKDREGRVVTTRLDEGILERLALDTAGRYYRATPSQVEVDEIAQGLVGMDAEEFGTVMRVRYEERYQLPLGVALAALIAETMIRDRRRVGRIPTEESAR
jgi:Ca-activated chloride channel family protein